MRKLFLSALVLGSFAANAQIKNDKGTFTKPTTGDYVFETQMRVDVTGAGAMFSLNDAILANLSEGMSLKAEGSKNYFPMIKVRKFKNDKSAERFGLNLSYSTNNTKDVSDPAQTSKTTNSDFGIALSYGREKHFNGAERLSTYVGYDATIAINMVTVKGTNGSTTVKSSQSGVGFGAKAFTGMDYYFIPKVYLGIELGYGLGFNSYGKEKSGSNNNGVSSSNLTLTPFVSPTFRLGYRF